MALALSGGWFIAGSVSLFDPDFARGFWPVAAVATPGFLVALAITWVRRLRPWQTTAVFLAVLGWGAPLLYALHRVLEAPELGTTGLLIVVFFAFGVFRLSPYLSALAGVSLSVVQQVLLVTTPSGDLHGGLAIHSVLIWVLLGATVVVATVLNRVERTQFVHEHVIAEQHRLIETERDRADSLLRNVLPEAIASRLKGGSGVIADTHDGVTILFADIVGFTPLSLAYPPDIVVKILDDVFSFLDQLADKYGVEKIKTVGDAYMAVAGAPEARDDHVDAIADLALGIRDGIGSLSDQLPSKIEMRIGIATGSAIAGVIGRRRLAYDLWSDTVNAAARMESHGVPGRIQVTDAVATALGDRYILSPRGSIDLKGIGPTRAWFLDERC